MDTYTRRESEIVVVDEDVVDTPVIGIENIHGIKLEKPTMRLLGTTLVNLLGPFGNFENDSNSDGLADGWTNDAGLTAVANAIETTRKIFGSKAQKITLSADGEGGNYIEVTIAAAQALFVAGYIRAGDTSTTGKLIVDWRDNTDTQISTDTVGTNATASYVRKSALLTAPANTVKARIYVTVAGVSGKLAYFDGIQVHNLTAQGALDPIRAAKYGVSNWSDLTAAQLEAEIPYFDSVMSVNVADGTASELTVENRGKNIMSEADLLSIPGSTIETKLGRRCIKIPNTAFPFIFSLSFQPLTQYTSTFYIYFETSNFSANLRFKYSDGTVKLIADSWPGKTVNTWNTQITTSDVNKSVSYIEVGIDASRPLWIALDEYQLEEGTSATDYVPPREDSITIPDTVELYGFGGYFNEWSGNQYTKRISMESKTTDGSGNLALSGYKSGTKAIIMNNDSGEVQILDVAASIATGWNSQECTVWYVLSSASTIEAKASGGIYIYEGQNNVLSPDSKANLAMMLGVTTEGTEETRAFVRNFSVNSRVNNIRFKPHFSRNVKTIPTSREYSISFDDPILDGDWDFRQHQDKPFTIKEKRSNGTESVDIKYHGCLISDLDTSEDDVMIHRVSLVAETKEVS